MAVDAADVDVDDDVDDDAVGVLVLPVIALLGVLVVTMLLEGVPAGSLDRGIALLTSI
jgi:hypothetical protein